MRSKCVCVCVCVLFSICFCICHLALLYELCPLFYLLKLLWDCFWLDCPPQLVLFSGSSNCQPSLFYCKACVCIPYLQWLLQSSSILLRSRPCLSKNLLDICNRISCKYHQLHPSKSEFTLFSLTLKFPLISLDLNKGTPSISPVVHTV